MEGMDVACNPYGDYISDSEDVAWEDDDVSHDAIEYPFYTDSSVTGVALRSVAHIEPAEVWVGDHVSAVPANRWDVDRFEFAGQKPVRFASCMPDAEFFDNSLFSISPQEASFMDPQSRLLLQTTFAALVGFRGETRELGVVVGTYQVEYGPSTMMAAVNAYTVTNMVTCPQAGRISYVFGMKGMCLVVDTACSSALVAASSTYNAIQCNNISAGISASVNFVMPVMHLACTGE